MSICKDAPEEIWRCLTFSPSPLLKSQIPGRMAHLIRRNNPEEVAAIRLIMNLLGAPYMCPRRACRRNNACGTPWVTCYFENLEFLQRHVFPVMDEIKRDMRANEVRLR